jgi:ATP-dependent Clp protease ATP-binding subunit ClpX
VAKNRTPTTVEKCTFCGKSRHMVESLIAGPPHVYICNECVELCNSILIEEMHKGEPRPVAAPEHAAPRRGPLRLDTLPPPRDIKAWLDEYVVSQEQTKRVLSVAVHNHYKRLLWADERGDRKHADPEDVELEKSNILLIGPTGSGKTLLAKTLARFLDVPFAIGDATTLTEAGYVGEDVENLLLKLLQAADWDRERAERGIIFVDEIDKIARTQNNVSITRDVSGEGVQQALLKILEGTMANVPPQGGRKHPEQQYIQMDTTNILFICGGTFVGLDELIRRRVGKKVIGFDREAAGDEAHLGEILSHVEPADLFEFGMIPEFVGRLPVLATLAPLRRAELMRVMTEPRNAIVRQYVKFFEMSGCELEFAPDALGEIADMAVAKGTGVRAVRAIVEGLLLDVLFDLPTSGQPQKFTITREVVRRERKILSEPLARPIAPSIRRKRETA